MITLGEVRARVQVLADKADGHHDPALLASTVLAIEDLDLTLWYV